MQNYFLGKNFVWWKKIWLIKEIACESMWWVNRASLRFIWECNVKNLCAVGVTGGSGRSALDVATAWHLRRWCVALRNSSTTSTAFPAPCARANLILEMNIIFWRIGNLFANLIMNKLKPKVYNFLIWDFLLFKTNFLFIVLTLFIWNCLLFETIVLFFAFKTVVVWWKRF